MVIPALVFLASSFVVAPVPTLRLVEANKHFTVPMFQPPVAAGRVLGSAALRSSLPTLGASSGLTPATKASLICHIIVVQADAKIDPKMAVEAPISIDPKIVRRSACADPGND